MTILFLWARPNGSRSNEINFQQSILTDDQESLYPPPMRRQKRQEQILDSAGRWFFERGFDKLSVSDLADTMGVSRGTFYLHFKSKRDVFLALVGRFEKDILNVFSSYSAVFHALGDLDFTTLSSCLFKHRHFLALVLTQGHTLEVDLLCQVQTCLKMIRDALENGMKTGAARGVFRPVDSRLAALSITGLVKEMVLQWACDDDETALGPHTQFLLDVVLRAFLARSVAAEIPTHFLSDRFLTPSPSSESLYS
jgi:AcrR family transcriptional regulator